MQCLQVYVKAQRIRNHFDGRYIAQLTVVIDQQEAVLTVIYRLI